MKYYIISGEASGDLHASNLMKGLKRNDEQAQFRGWGGDMMRAAFSSRSKSAAAAMRAATCWIVWTGWPAKPISRRKSVLIDAGFEEFSYICLLNKKLFRVDKEEKTILPIVGISIENSE